MIILLNGQDKHMHLDLFDQMFRLRARSFKDRRGWSVDVTEGREFDRFDELNPLYILNVAGDGKLLASLRLLKTTGPHMLADIFPETLNGQPPIRDSLIWESTRFCVDTKKAESAMANGVNKITGELLAGLFETAHRVGLRQIVSVYDLYMERVLRRAGCIFDRLGCSASYDGLSTVAGIFEVSQRAIDGIRTATGINKNLFLAPAQDLMEHAHVCENFRDQQSGFLTL